MMPGSAGKGAGCDSSGTFEKDVKASELQQTTQEQQNFVWKINCFRSPDTRAPAKASGT
jgi:hypothetical protein